MALTLLICAVPPATNVGPGPAGYVLVLLALSVAALWLHDPRVQVRPLSRAELCAGGVLFGWVGLGVLRADGMRGTALAATVLAVLAVVCAWTLVRRVGAPSVSALVVLMCGATLVGSAIAAWIVPLVLGQGIGLRPGLPIGGASNNAVGLTLALAGTLAGARRWPDHRWAWWCLAILGGLLVLQSVSRAAWIMALVVVLGAAQIHRRWAPLKVALAGTVTAAGTLLALVALRGPSALVDTARVHNAATGLDAWSGSPPSVILGLGPMQVWPWLELERSWAVAGAPGTTWHDGPWGEVLYHAHSTYLLLLVEYGVIGLLALLVVLGLVVRRCVREIRRQGDLALVAIAVLLALPAMVVELYLFRQFPSAFLWWTAVLAVGCHAGAPAAGESPAVRQRPPLRG